MLQKLCSDCWESSEGIYSDHYHAFLCDDCHNQRCYDEGALIEMDDLEDCGDEYAS